MIPQEALLCLRWWREWHSLRVLPWGGCDLMEQPAFVLDAFRVCEQAEAAYVAEERKRLAEAESR